MPTSPGALDTIVEEPLETVGEAERPGLLITGSPLQCIHFNVDQQCTTVDEESNCLIGGN